MCFDGLAFVESRTGVIDIIAIALAALLWYAFLLHWQARTRKQWTATLYFMARFAVGDKTESANVFWHLRAKVSMYDSSGFTQPLPSISAFDIRHVCLILKGNTDLFRSKLFQL